MSVNMIAASWRCSEGASGMEWVNLETSYLRVQQCKSQCLSPTALKKEGARSFELGIVRRKSSGRICQARLRL